MVSQDAVIENAIEMHAASIDERTKAQDEKVIFPKLNRFNLFHEKSYLPWNAVGQIRSRAGRPRAPESSKFLPPKYMPVYLGKRLQERWGARV